MMLPTIHMNGTGKADLVEQAYNVFEAANALIDKLAKACPNGRDYYPQGGDAIGKAREEHFARFAAVRKIMEEMEAIMLHCEGNGK